MWLLSLDGADIVTIHDEDAGGATVTLSSDLFSLSKRLSADKLKEFKDLIVSKLGVENGN
jgi:hypothetical protein